jgi:lipooligosaccharide transport system permease protein
MEPLIFLAGVGIGLGKFIGTMENLPYLEFLATALLVTSAMFTSAFECSYETFIRLEFDKVYDGMLSAPLTVNNVLLGEILWAGTKGFFFSFAVLLIMSIFGILPFPNALLTPFIGFLTGVMFGAISLWITSFVKTINHFSFYFTGILSPMFFFSGVIFPISHLPKVIQPLAWIFPLSHPVALSRHVCKGEYDFVLLLHLLYIIGMTVVAGFLGFRGLRKRMIR